MALLAKLTNRLPSELADYYRGREADFLVDLSLLTRGERLIGEGREEGDTSSEGFQHTEAYLRMIRVMGPPPKRYGQPIDVET